MRNLMISVAALMLFQAGLMAADDIPAIDNYSFSWTLAKSGESEISVDKTQDTTIFRVRTSFDSASLSGDEAEAIGAILARVDDYWKKLKGDKEGTETVPAGKYEVRFANDPKVGFYLTIRHKEAFFSASVLLKREQAKQFSAYMQRAKKLMELVDGKIKP